MRLEFPKGTDPDAAEALRYCRARFPTFPLQPETVTAYLAELSKPGAAQAARELADELGFFPAIGQIRTRALQPAAAHAGPPYLQPTEPLGPPLGPPRRGWGGEVADWIKRGAKGPPPSPVLRE